MESEENLIKTCIKAGACKAFVITTDKIPFDENLRSYCEANYCGSYGKNYSCPPSVSNSKELIAKAKNYKKALIFQTVTQIEDSFYFEGILMDKILLHILVLFYSTDVYINRFYKFINSKLNQFF